MYLLITISVASVTFVLGCCFGFLVGAFYKDKDYEYD